MLNPFPELLTFSLLGPFVLRVVVGLIFLDLGILKLRGEKQRWVTTFEALRIVPADLFVVGYGLLEVAGGIMLILGFYTQVAALAFALFSGIEFYLESRDSVILKRNLVFYALLCAISLSLLLTGAGAFAIDIPL